MMPIPTDRLGGKISNAGGKIEIGDDYRAKDSTYSTFGISIGGHSNQVEIHGDEALRDRVLCLLDGANPRGARWEVGAFVQKIRGSIWRGKVCGYYTTKNTPIGYAVESLFEPGSVQVWPEAALEDWNPEHKQPDLVDALIKLDELAHQELMSVRPETENRETYKDGFFSGVLALAGKIRDAIRKIADIDSAVTTADLTPAPLTEPGANPGSDVLPNSHLRIQMPPVAPPKPAATAESGRVIADFALREVSLTPHGYQAAYEAKAPQPAAASPRPASAETRGNIVKRLMADGCWTPYNLEVLLHHYCSSTLFPRADAPAYPGCIATLQREALMNEDKTLSDAGIRFVETLCRTRLP